MKKFVIVSLPRTGTTMLCIALDHVNGFDVYGEILTNKYDHTKIKVHPQEAIENFKRKSQKNNLWNFLTKNIKNPDKEIPLKNISKKDVYDFLDYTYNKDSKYVGFKLLYPHLDRLPYVKDYILEKNIYVVHLYRNDLFEQVLSALTNQHMHFGKGKMTIKKYDNIPEKMKKNSQLDLKLHKIFGKNEDRYTNICYEEMTCNKHADILNVDSIFELLECKEDCMINTYTKKYGPSMKDRIENFDEIYKFVFKGDENV